AGVAGTGVARCGGRRRERRGGRGRTGDRRGGRAARRGRRGGAPGALDQRGRVPDGPVDVDHLLGQRVAVDRDAYEVVHRLRVGRVVAQRAERVEVLTPAARRDVDRGRLRGVDLSGAQRQRRLVVVRVAHEPQVYGVRFE